MIKMNKNKMIDKAFEMYKLKDEYVKAGYNGPFKKRDQIYYGQRMTVDQLVVAKKMHKIANS